MSVGAFLAELRRRDIEVWADGDHLRCKAAAGVLTPELREALRQRKSDLLEFLRSAQTLAEQPRAIVPLQPRGHQVPVFAVAGHNGDVFCYRALAQRLGGDQPFFGLLPPGLDGNGEPLRSVEELAAHFAGQIRTFRPQGPYVIAGYCAGGTVAFELARQLHEQGAPIHFVALFASPFPTAYRPLRLARQHLALRLGGLRRRLGALAALPHRERGRYIRGAFRQRKERRKEAAAVARDPAMIRRGQLEAITLAAVCRYEPGPFPGRVSLFLPNREWLRFGNALQRWRALATDVEEYRAPAGCKGDDMLLAPQVEAVAELFGRCRDAVEARTAVSARAG